MHPMVKCLLHNLKQVLIHYQIVLLNQMTVRNYINSTLINDNFNKLPLPNQSDFFRFHILCEYGGVYFDSSSYLKDEKLIDEWRNEMILKKSDFLGFNFKYEPTNNIELGIILAPKGSKFLDTVKKEYDDGLEKGSLQKIKDYLSKGLVINVPYQYRSGKDDEEPFISTFFFSYFCVQWVYQKIYNYNANIIVKKAEEWTYKLHEDNQWNRKRMMKIWNKGLDNSGYEIIKFTKGDRKRMKIACDVII